jgi:hypothetical protein
MRRAREKPQAAVGTTMMDDASNQPPLSKPARASNYGWIVYFALLIIASIGVAVGMIYFNRMIQLTPEQVTEARALWKEKAPRDYKLLFIKRINDDPKPITFAITVKDSKVIHARKDGIAIESDGAPSMDGMFGEVERLLQVDREPGAKKVYTIARFDGKTGALLHFVHNGPERIQIDVKPDWMEK